MEATGNVGGGVVHPVAAGAGAAANSEATIADTHAAAVIALREPLLRTAFTATTPLGPIRASYPC